MYVTRATVDPRTDKTKVTARIVLGYAVVAIGSAGATLFVKIAKKRSLKS